MKRKKKGIIIAANAIAIHYGDGGDEKIMSFSGGCYLECKGFSIL